MNGFQKKVMGARQGIFVLTGALMKFENALLRITDGA